MPFDIKVLEDQGLKAFLNEIDPQLMDFFKETNPQKLETLAKNLSDLYQYKTDYLDRGVYDEKWVSPVILAADFGSLPHLNALLKLEQHCQSVARVQNKALNQAARGGHLDIVNRLLEFDAVKGQVAINGNEILRVAASEGHLDIVNRLLEFDAVKDQVAINDNVVLRWAASQNHLDVVKRLLKLDAVKAQVAAYNNGALRWAGGHLDIVDLLLDYSEVRIALADANNNTVLYGAALDGHSDVVNRLLRVDAVRESAVINDNEVLRGAASRGYLNVVNELLRVPQVRELATKNNAVLREAAEEGHLNVVNRLLEFPEMEELITTKEVLYGAVSHGHLNVVNRLLEFDAVKKWVVANIDEVLEWAVESDKPAMVGVFLGFPNVLKNKLDTLKQRKEAFEKEMELTDTEDDDEEDFFDEDSLDDFFKFNIYNENEAELYFYIIHYLLRHKGSFDDICFLLDIPKVKAWANYNENELLHLALETGNNQVADLLRKIPEVDAHEKEQAVKGLRAACEEYIGKLDAIQNNRSGKMKIFIKKLLDDLNKSEADDLDKIHHFSEQLINNKSKFRFYHDPETAVFLKRVAKIIGTLLLSISIVGAPVVFMEWYSKRKEQDAPYFWKTPPTETEQFHQKIGSILKSAPKKK